MIIQCNSCDKKFNVPDGAITEAGRLVQCSSCGNKWTQYPLKQTPEIVKTPPIVKKQLQKKKLKNVKVLYRIQKNICKKNGGPSIEKYAVDKGLTSKVKKVKTTTKTQKTTEIKNYRKTRIWFF